MLAKRKTTAKPNDESAPFQRQKFRDLAFDEKSVAEMTSLGIADLMLMQLPDGGWSWFSGWGAQSSPHITATVLHGLHVAAAARAAVPPETIASAMRWLSEFQAEQVRRLNLWPNNKPHGKEHADNLDALIYLVLVDGGKDDVAMREFLFRDRVELAVYAKAVFGLALNKIGDRDKLTMIMKNIEQFRKQDDENQTAWLELGNQSYWWWWYGSEVQAHAYYLKLLAAVEPKGETCLLYTSPSPRD